MCSPLSMRYRAVKMTAFKKKNLLLVNIRIIVVVVVVVVVVEHT